MSKKNSEKEIVFTELKEELSKLKSEQSSPISQTPTIEDLFSDLKLVYEKLKSENSTADMTRDYYKKYGNYSRSAYEKYFNTFTDFKKAYLESGNTDDTTISYKKKIHTVEEKNKTLEKENQELIKKSVNEDYILNLYKSKQISIPTPIKFNFIKEKNECKEAALVLSDFHAGEVIVKNQLNGINEYNVEIMKQRVDRIIYYAIYYCKKNEIDVLNLLFLGDLMSGSIHPELARTNEYNDVETLFILHEYITQKILELEPHFSKIKCEFIVGNHSRISDGNNGTKLQWKTAPILNWEYVLARQLEMQFDLIQKQNKIKKISISVNDCLFKVIEIAKRKFLIAHGHTMSGGSNSFAGIGYYGLAQSNAKLLGAMISTGDDKLVFQDSLAGHYHFSSRIKTTVGNMYVNGSVIGAGEYGLYKMRSISDPEQLLLFVENGYVTNEIILRGND